MIIKLTLTEFVLLMGFLSSLFIPLLLFSISLRSRVLILEREVKEIKRCSVECDTRIEIEIRGIGNSLDDLRELTLDFINFVNQFFVTYKKQIYDITERYSSIKQSSR